MQKANLKHTTAAWKWNWQEVCKHPELLIQNGLYINAPYKGFCRDLKCNYNFIAGNS